MRVLWTSNILFSDLRQAEAISSGSWLEPLARALVDGDSGVTLGVVTTSRQTPPGRREKNGIVHYVIPGGIVDTVRAPSRSVRGEFARAVADFAPDVIHVNGSEFNYGMLALDHAAGVPIVLSIQGVAGVWARAARRAERELPVWRFRSARDWIRGVLIARTLHLGRYRRETEIIERVAHVIGRTTWDRAYVRAVNPQATYHHVEEMMRPMFWEKAWDRRAVRRHTVCANAPRGPVKGAHVLFEAARLLKRDYPDLRIRLPGARSIGAAGRKRWVTGTGYDNYAAHLMRKYGLQDHVECLGVLDGQAIAGELATAHAFVVSSFMENSSNSLAEAMLVGTPCVAPYVGGLPTLLHDRVEGLMYPVGDAAVLAESLRRVFEDDSLCETLSQRARDAAMARHRPERILGDLQRAYGIVAGDGGK
jgi:glycosyltransferase involved in cell wall biosynthesis